MAPVAIHKVYLNTAQRVSGSAFDAMIPVKIPNLLNPSKITCVRLEHTSIFSSTSPIGLYVASQSLSLPYTYSTVADGENSILGKISYINSDATSAYMAAVAGDNLVNTSTNIEGVLRSNQINIRLLTKDGTLATAYTSDWSLCLAFYEADDADVAS